MRIWCEALPVVLVPAVAFGSTARVPADYATIQAALDVSSVGDTVLVAPGTYSDYTLVGISAEVGSVPDGVVLASEAGPEVTTIDLAPLDGVASSYAAFGCGNHASGLTVIEGFHVMGFPRSGYSVGVSVGYSAHVEVRNCVFEVADLPDAAFDRKGISTRHTELHVVDCSFIRCSGYVGAGVAAVGGAVTVEGCTFLECQNQGIRAIQGTGAATNSLTVRDCLFRRCTSNVDGGCISTQSLGDGVLVSGCRFEEPTVIGSPGAAMALGGAGLKTLEDNLFRDMDLTYGACCVYLVGGSGLVTNNTFAYCRQPPGLGDGVALQTDVLANVVFERNIVAHTFGSTAVAFLGGGSVTAGCNVFWDNPDGIGYTPFPTDRIIDPLFCDEELRDLTLHESSPCLPKNSVGCDLIGALGQGCGAVSVEAQSWGKTKSAYRSEEEE